MIDITNGEGTTADIKEWCGNTRFKLKKKSFSSNGY